jgi:hypothetical protein
MKGAREQIRTADCGGQYWGTAIAVFYDYATKWVLDLAEKYKGDKQIYFINMSDIFPPAGEQRRKFFLDEAHMYDSGQELVGIYYAYKILASDFPKKAVEYEKTMKALMSSLITATPLDPANAGSPTDGIKAAAGPIDILADGGMEKWRSVSAMDSWKVYGAGSSVTQETAIKKSGAFSAKLTRAGEQTLLYQIAEVPANTSTYTLSGWVYQTAGAANRGGLIISFAGGENASVYHSGSATGWEYLTVSAVNTNKTRLDANCINFNSAGDVYFDGVSLHEQPALISKEVKA